MQKNGINTYEAETWQDLNRLFETNFKHKLSFAFRGQRREEWGLRPTLTRRLMDVTKFEPQHSQSIQLSIERHVALFRNSILGRRGENPKQLSENELWALGQHYGLDTPLLDWTRSPYVAAFFAFRSDTLEGGNRAIWALDINALKYAANGLEQFLAKHPNASKNKFGANRSLIEIVIPESDENRRLISQAGLFTKIPFYSSLEQWAEKYMPGALSKIVIPNSERDSVLRSLTQMNVSDATLFPDLEGAARYSNYMLEVHGNGSTSRSRQNLGLVHVGYDLLNLAD